MAPNLYPLSAQLASEFDQIESSWRATCQLFIATGECLLEHSLLLLPPSEELTKYFFLPHIILFPRGDLENNIFSILLHFQFHLCMATSSEYMRILYSNSEPFFFFPFFTVFEQQKGA